MSFFIAGQLVGTINGSQSPSGAVGLAVQDAESVRFDDFTISGPNVAGTGDNVAKPTVSSLSQTAAGAMLRFTIEPPYDYYVQVSSSPAPSHDWQTIATFCAKLVSKDVVFTEPNSNGVRFYRIEKVPCYCR